MKKEKRGHRMLINSMNPFLDLEYYGTKTLIPLNFVPYLTATVQYPDLDTGN